MSTLTIPSRASSSPQSFDDLARRDDDGTLHRVVVVTGKQLAALLGVDPTTLRRMTKRNQLPVRAVGVDSRPRYSVHSVLRWLLEREPTDADVGANCRLLTIAQTGPLLGCSRATAYRLLGVPHPPITPTPVGDETRFPACRVLAYIDAAS